MPDRDQIIWLLSKMEAASGCALVALIIVGAIGSWIGHPLTVEYKPFVAFAGAVLGLMHPVPRRS